MNFVDVQPKSFLDYAWTSPAPTVMTTTKSSKTSRKQNRCCDQCRKGKRACDAAILEDALLDDNNVGGNPSSFHYSDVFGPLAPCGNCTKTKKNCTFEWLRSQRVSQSTQPPVTPVPPTKRRRTSSNKTLSQDDDYRQIETVGPTNQPVTINDGICAQHATPLDPGITFADFPGQIPGAFDAELSSIMVPKTESPMSTDMISTGSTRHLNDIFEFDETLQDHDSSKGSSLETCSESRKDGTEKGSPSASSTKTMSNSTANYDRAVIRISRKRRRRGSSSSNSNGALPYPTVSLTSDLIVSTNNAFLTEGLLRIYHNSFENALSCWVTERTCPYSASADVSLINEARPDWNRIYHRVFRLDRLAANIRGRQLTFTEDQVASKALNLAILSFSAQWAQSSQRTSARYPFDGAISNDASSVLNSDTERPTQASPEFDRSLQINAWHEAQTALRSAGEIESFRIVLAQIVFALTQKPVETTPAEQEAGIKYTNKKDNLDHEPGDTDDDLIDCEDLLSKLNLAIDAEGPPTHLEQGLRLIHSLRSRMTIRNEQTHTKSGALRCGGRYRSSTGRLGDSDRATVDLLFWLGVMLDTLSSAMNKRPLVVSDEDSDIYPNGPEQIAKSSGNKQGVSVVNKATGLWDGYLFARQDSRLQNEPTRWPCSFDQAAAILCDAAPVKVLLFRKITRIQTLITRNARGVKIEASLSEALDVCGHWTKLYAPFIQDCIQYHDHLHPRIQSWYTCLTGHWHLATLLLADLIEIVDDSEVFGLEQNRTQRLSTNFLAYFRENNCRIVSDMARCACPRDGSSFSQSHEFHFALNQGSLLTEPWTVVLIRLFAKAGLILLESDEMLPLHSVHESGDDFQRADDCVRALWYLGRKSDMALSAAKILGNALKERRKGAQEKVNDMSSFLDTELWHGFEDLEGVFNLDCEV
ncbi:hypothetical protein GQ44DRAFT_680626 [Phaeosphaeriaceae sp. PMI808]|nr:hypothetical protein GQ44DRAFT_680626 [Phaeosphaeriaceae sp. PMI808]